MSESKHTFTLHDHVLLAYLQGNAKNYGSRTFSVGIMPRVFQNLQYPEITEALFLIESFALYNCPLAK